MATRKIVTLGGPKEGVLRAKAKKVSRFDEHLERLVADMWQTMREAPGVGLAAPQVGESIRVLVAQYEENAVALVNPEIMKVSEETVLGTEGCLSIPGIVGDNVERHDAVVVKARNPKGKEIRVRAQGWFARVLQHEIDHLDGILFTDRIKPEDIREVTEEDIEEAEGKPSDAAKAARAATGKKSSATMNGKSAQPASAVKTGAAASKPASKASVKAEDLKTNDAVNDSGPRVNDSGPRVNDSRPRVNDSRPSAKLAAKPAQAAPAATQEGAKQGGAKQEGAKQGGTK